MQPAKRQKYDEKYKIDIVKSILAGNTPVSVYAHKIGIDQSILHRWVKKYQNVENYNQNHAVIDKLQNNDEIARIKEDLASMKQTVFTLRSIMERVFKEKYEC